MKFGCVVKVHVEETCWHFHGGAWGIFYTHSFVAVFIAEDGVVLDGVVYLAFLCYKPKQMNEL